MIDPKPTNKGGMYCKHGHDLSDAWISNDGRRHCRECARRRNRTLRAKGRSDSDRASERKHYQDKKGGPKEIACTDCGTAITVFSTLNQRRCQSCIRLRYHEPRPCPICGEMFVPGYSRLRYCSKLCAFSKLSQDRGGDGNPSFRHGKRVGVQIPGWRLQAKGERVCRNCRVGGSLQLHHIVPRGKWKAGEADLRNGVPLCFECHHGWHHHKVVLYRDIFSEEEWAFVTSAELTGQRIEAWLDDRYPERPMS